MQHVTQMFPGLLQSLRHAPPLLTSVWRAVWVANVGSATAAHTYVSRFEKGTLTVLVDHHAWHQQLIRIRPDLIKTLNQACGRTALMDVDFIYRASQTAQSKVSDAGVTDHPALL
jgi:predicted nucleic acid-binding Zn ribbon protein